MKSNIVYIDEEKIYKLGDEPFIAYYCYQYKYCLAMFNDLKHGSIIPMTPYFKSIKEAHDYYTKKAEKQLKELGVEYFDNFIIVNRYQSFKCHL